MSTPFLASVCNAGKRIYSLFTAKYVLLFWRECVYIYIYLTSNAVTFIWKSRGKTNAHNRGEQLLRYISLRYIGIIRFLLLAQQLYRIDLTIFRNKGQTRYEYWISMEHGWRRNLSLSFPPSPNQISLTRASSNIKTEMNFHFVFALISLSFTRWNCNSTFDDGWEVNRKKYWFLSPLSNNSTIDKFANLFNPLCTYNFRGIRNNRISEIHIHLRLFFAAKLKGNYDILKMRMRVNARDLKKIVREWINTEESGKPVARNECNSKSVNVRVCVYIYTRNNEARRKEKEYREE